MSDELKDDVNALKKAVFGDIENPKETPGVVHELTAMNSTITQIGATLTDIKQTLARINWIILAAFISALVALVFKSAPTMPHL